MPTFLGIPLSFDPAAATLAVIAVAIAWHVWRVTTSHRAKIVRFSHPWSGYPTRMGISVVIRNTGLPIHQPSVWLAFVQHKPDGTEGKVNIALGQKPPGVFEYGFQMTFETFFDVPVTGHHRHTVEWLSCFSRQTLRETNPRIVIKSGEFEAVSIRLVPRFHRVLSQWNRFAYCVNSWFDRKTVREGDCDFVRPGKILPKLGLSAWPTLQLIGQDAVRELERGKENPGSANR